MIQLGVLRVIAAEALPFAREKLRACLVIGGLRRVFASQITAAVSQAMRSALPAEIFIYLEDDHRQLCLRPREYVGRYERIALPSPLDDVAISEMKSVLARLTREELVNDLERQVQERTADLWLERERSERLLRNMLPDAIAQRMKDGETIADVHQATVLFADIKGFTALASKRSAPDVVALLDRIFSEFDSISHRHSLEKIKTIGDAYLAAAGLPMPQMDHVDRAIVSGLDMVDAVSGLRDELGADIDVRVGIHTGPVVAGVIGTAKYAYDVWGDTVNIASRMESQGIPGKVQISDDVRQVLGRRYQLVERGAIEIKNRGSMRTWLVTGLAALESGAV